MKTAEPTDWKTEPMPELQTVLSLEMLYTAEQMACIRRGCIPREMEDKWFVYWSDNHLYFHRSWTGFCIYIVRFDCEDMGAKAVEAVVNRDTDQYGSTDDDYDRGMIEFLISVLLLRRPIPFPSNSESKHRRALEMWSQVGRAGLGVHPDDEETLN